MNSQSPAPERDDHLSARTVAFHFIAAGLFYEVMIFVVLSLVLASVVRVFGIVDATVLTCTWWAFLIVAVRVPLSLTWLWAVSARSLRELVRGEKITKRPLSGRYGRPTSALVNLAETVLAAGLVFGLQPFSTGKTVVLVVVAALTCLIFGQLVLERRGRQQTDRPHRSGTPMG
jgi:hypothetical protein